MLIVYANVLPANALAGPLFVSAIRETQSTGTMIANELSFWVGSGVVDVIEPLKFRIVPRGVEDGVVTVRKCAVEPGGRSVVEQVIVPLPPTGGIVQDHPAGAASEMNVVLFGVSNVSTTFSASSGPSLFALIVN